MTSDGFWLPGEIAPDLLIYGPGDTVRRLADLDPSEEFHRCFRCRKNKIASEFSPGNGFTCLGCLAEYQRERRTDPEILERERANGRARYAADPSNQRDRTLRSKFGISLEEYELRKAAQNGVCVLCLQPETAVLSNGNELDLAIDHDHRHQHTKPRVGCPDCIRDLLCRDCNVTLGRINDSIEWLDRARAYLRKWNDRPIAASDNDGPVA